MMTKILAIDDERIIRERLKSLLIKYKLGVLISEDMNHNCR